MSIISTMIQISVLFLPLFVVFASFTELIVFNEEVLLLFCFVSFLLYIYNAIGGLVFQSFVDQAQALEQQFSDTLVLSFQARSLQLDKLNTVRRVANCAVGLLAALLSGALMRLAKAAGPGDTVHISALVERIVVSFSSYSLKVEQMMASSIVSGMLFSNVLILMVGKPSLTGFVKPADAPVLAYRNKAVFLVLLESVLIA